MSNWENFLYKFTMFINTIIISITWMVFDMNGWGFGYFLAAHIALCTIHLIFAIRRGIND